MKLKSVLSSSLLVIVCLVFTACAGQQTVDPMAFEDTSWLQTPEETEEAMGISFMDFEKEDKDQTVRYTNADFQKELKISGVKPSMISFLYIPVDEAHPLSLRAITMEFQDDSEEEKMVSYLNSVYGDAEEGLLKANDSNSVYYSWEKENEKEKISIRQTPPGTFNPRDYDTFLITYGWTSEYAAELLEGSSLPTE